MLNKAKTNPELGLEISNHLKEKGVETPMTYKFESSKVNLNKIEKNFRNIMTVLGMDLEDDSLTETPKRVAKMFLNEIFWGLDTDNFPKMTAINNKMKYDEMIISKGVKVSSTCEHHFLPIIGEAYIAYIPNEKVLGLSKLNRIVEYFSKRPQVQERLTEQIFYALSYILETEDIAVLIDAKHTCVSTRGVEDYNSTTITSKLGGLFIENSKVRSEFLKLIK